MSFLSPIFLIALATAALPILYHLVRRVQAKKVQFSSLMFLKMTPREVVRRRRIQHWLLMAMRCFLLALLALAFARPYIPRESIPFVSQREDRSVVLLLDNSYSMQYGDLLERARAAAREKLGEAAGEDEFAVIQFSNEMQQLTPLSSDLALHQNVIENVVAPSYRTTDFYQPLRLAEEVLSEANHNNRHIVLISDLQLNGWKGAFENWKLDPTISFEVVDVSEAAPANTFVEDFGISEKRSAARLVHRFDARLGTSEETENEVLNMMLEIEGETVGNAEVPVSTIRRSSFQYSAPREGFFQGNVRLPEDALPVDDTRYFTFSVEGRPVLLGLGGSRRDPAHAVYYLDRAFNQGDQSIYAFVASQPASISRSTLQEANVVFLSSGNPQEREINALKSFVQAGGSLVISFGEQADVAGFSNLMQGLEAGTVEGFVQARTVQGYDAIIGEVDMRHPVFSVFATSGSGSIFRPRFRRYAQITPDSTASILGRYDSEDPFLFEKEIGQGKVLVYTSSFSPAWTDFSINEMYIPFLYQLTKYALETRSDQRQFTVGELVRLEGPANSSWDVRAPGGDIFKVEMDSEGQGFFEETEIPGHYVAARGNEQRYFSVNVDVEESMLEKRDAEEAHGAVVPPPDDVPVSVEMARTIELDDEERQQKFWRYVIILIVLLYLVETTLANKRRKGI